MIKITKASVEDVNKIYNNIKQCADDMAKNGLKHWIPYYSVDNIRKDILNNNVFLVNYEDNNIGNFILISNDNELYISKFAIIPSYENKGIGSKCLRFIEDYAKQNRFKSIKLDVYDKSAGAIIFYQKNGYKIIGEKPTRRFNVKIMQKELKEI